MLKVELTNDELMSEAREMALEIRLKDKIIIKLQERLTELEAENVSTP